MTKKLALFLLAGACLVISVFWFVDREFAAPELGQDQAASDQGIIETNTGAQTNALVSDQAAPAVALPKPDPARETTRVREARIELLEELSMNDDTASLETILFDLENPDKEIRTAALEAAIQFGERTNTIARLQELETRIEDAEERAAIHEAIEYIALPSLREVMAERRASRPKINRTAPSQPTQGLPGKPPATPAPTRQVR